ncbi:Exodeoxyribonuclease 1 [Grifola frondosa]|uniref:Exodeoxyribonuclease 1 n=1 Tax=Grifola frondosa TaxID=5627 RepID=A0A1C7LTT3_GRIFR|nr:Exodeoxyribonuclease 1 [Grifola frondosa]
MGISGLLPLLKDIQVNKHLSEFRGQTMAVDGYVWLHRGTYGCAAELATGKKTTRYVDYAMHRVRLLRHHGIQPYVVFDGGPLPAKKGTEVERKKRRDENLSRANAFAAQGKHSQAREFYVKCIDVTPQMAYQLIKALKAESVPYVVAPYEADAQLAYLEKIGLVDGIITEDSDLLVFGCKTVLFKMEPATCTRYLFVRLVRRAIPYYGDSQRMRLLPSIPGIGLKTAWALLRKYKTVENMVGLRRRCSLHQRVYDPMQEKLVNLTDLPDDEDWDDEKEAYIGSHIEPSLAKQVADGDACPISLLPMQDINPTYIPRAIKTIPMNSTCLSRPDKDNGKAKLKHSEKPSGIGLLKFFSTSDLSERYYCELCSDYVHGVVLIAPKSKEGAVKDCPQNSAKAVKTAPAVGRSSGKRTLAEVMDQDIAAKRKKQEIPYSNNVAIITSSKFFCEVSAPSPRGGVERTSVISAVAGPSHLSREEEKENIPCLSEEDIHREAPDPVVQEDGYISPSPSLTRCGTPDVSSPVRPDTGPSKAGGDDWNDDRGADVLSNPPIERKRSRFGQDEFPRALSRRRTWDSAGVGMVLVRGTPSQSEHEQDELGSAESGPDLRDVFDEWDEVMSEIEGFDEFQQSARSAACTSESVTPDEWSQERGNLVIHDSGEEGDAEEFGRRPNMLLQLAMRRSPTDGGRSGRAVGRMETTTIGETTMTPEGRQRPVVQRPHSAQSVSKQKGQQDLRVARRRSLVFLKEDMASPKDSLLRDTSSVRPGSAGSEDGIAASAKNRFAEFR